jgi:hypothetical protein
MIRQFILNQSLPFHHFPIEHLRQEMEKQKTLRDVEALKINSILIDEINARRKQLKLTDRDIIGLTGFSRTAIKTVFAQKTSLYKAWSKTSVGSRRLKTILVICEKIGIQVRVRIKDYYGPLDEEAFPVICKFCLEQGANHSSANSVFLAQARYYTGQRLDKPPIGYGAIRMLEYYELFGGLYELEITIKDVPVEIPKFTLASGGTFKVRPPSVPSSVFNLTHSRKDNHVFL